MEAGIENGEVRHVSGARAVACGAAGGGALWRAAFGGAGEVGAPLGELPPARTAEERWLRAVALGGQGWYAAARQELAACLALGGGPHDLPWRSLCLSAYGSLVRQVGRHGDAAVFDGRAALAATDPQSRCDAITGLAADALGRGRLALASRLLERLDGELRAVSQGALPRQDFRRQEIRRGWVRAELALASGDGPAALTPAREARELAEGWTSARHQVKSRLLCAAALSASPGGARRAVELAERSVEEAAAAGFLPLAWASSMLLVGLCPGGGSRAWERERDTYAERLARRGGRVG